SCTLYQVDVEGDIRVSPNGTLVLNGEEEWSNIDGNIEAQNCRSVLLKGSVTLKGNISVRNCAFTSGFVCPGIDVRGNFLGLNNNGPCQAALGKVGGDVVIGSNRSRAASDTSDISLSTIGGNLICQNNAPPPTHALGGDWVKGNLLGQCGLSAG